MVEYCNQFLKEIKVIKSDLVKFEEDGSMKSKIYLESCILKGLN